jgi:signal transduction histidine kinase
MATRAQLDAVGRLAQYVLIPRIAAPGLTIVAVQRNPQMTGVLLIIVPLMMTSNYLALRHWDKVVRELNLSGKPFYLLLDSALALTVLAIAGLGTPMVLYVMSSALLSGLIYRTRLVLAVDLVSTLAYVVLLVANAGYVPGARDFHTTVTLPTLLLMAGPAGIALRRLLQEQERTSELLARLRASEAIREERLRVARDLHDSLVKNLHGVWLLSRTLEGSLERGDQVSARTAARVIGDTARSLAAGARSAITGLRDPEQPSRPLLDALQQTADRTVAGHSIVLDVRDDRARQDAVPAPEGCNELLAVAAEALHNTVKHAAAKRVVVLLEDSPEGVGLVISDDGKGFVDARIDDLPQDGHFGLLGMRERATRVGGCLSVRSAPGHGTTVRLSLPSAGQGLKKAAIRAGDVRTPAWIRPKKAVEGA